ncbi:MAG: GspE/PulE family protein [Gaiellaceae bacterium]
MTTRGKPTPSRELTLGTLLVRDGVIDETQLRQALDAHERSGRRSGDILVEREWTTTAELARSLAEQYGLDFVEILDAEIDPEATKLLSGDFLRRHQVLPLRHLGRNALLVAVGDPTDIFALDNVKLALGLDLTFCLADPGDLAQAIERACNSSSLALIDEASLEHATPLAPALELTRGEFQSTAANLVNHVLAQGIRSGASDLHFDPQEQQLLVRARVDGVAHELLVVPRTLQQEVVTRLKVMAKLDIAERRLPQDGRTTVRLDGVPADLRLAVVPTMHGEKVAIRILRRATSRVRLLDLGMSESDCAEFTKAVEQPFGCVVVCGPTGAGKTTTLYAALDHLNTPERVLTTIEDPVEYELPGVLQIQVNPKSGLTFSRGLRTVLRSDPDVLLVGEIRDPETAEIAVQAAMTGHLVLTTVHARSASGALARLQDMGVEPFMLGEAINCIVGQRLVRRLCESCRQPCEPTEDERAVLGPLDAETRLFQAGRCARCSDSGFHGRTGIFEVLPMTHEIRELLGGPTHEIEAVARRDGMAGLRQDAYRVARAGTTSLQEVRRVLGDLSA